MSDETEYTDEAPGWDAINEALRPIYGDREPYHVGTVIPYALGGPNPIHGISAYKNDEPRPHWHFVTYGLSELWQKESTDPKVSGYGFELTLRTVCKPKDKRPPNWALNFLQNLGRYVFTTGNTFGAGHTLPLNGPIKSGGDTLIHAASFAPDPQLPPISTPNGRVEFLQIVGLTMDELEAISSWNASAFLKLRGRDDPFLLTDLDRTSWMRDPRFAAAVARRSKKDGSSCEWLSLILECEVKNREIEVRVQTIAVDCLSRRLLGRLPYGRELTLNGDEATVVFRPGKKSSVRIVEGAVTITLRDADLVEFAALLEPHVGKYPIPGLKNVILEVVRTEIKDQKGRVVEIIE